MSEPHRVEYGTYVDAFTWSKIDSKRSGSVGFQYLDHRKFYHDLRESSLNLMRKSISLFQEESHAANFNQASDELEWSQEGKPYYKVDPRLLPHLLVLNADIPSEHLCVPFGSFEIRLPKNGLQEGEDKPWIRAILVSKYTKEELEEAKRAYRLQMAEADNILVLRLSLGEEPHKFYREGVGEVVEIAPSQLFVKIYLTEGKGLFECLQERLPDMPGMQGYIPSQETIEKALRIAVGVSLMACHNAELLTPDIPRKLADRYRQARRQGNDKSLHEIESKRIKLGMGKGWVIGMEEWERPVIVSGQGEMRGSLKFGHWRSAHPRLQPSGPRSKPVYRLIFVKPVRIRKDLPLNPKESAAS